MESEDGRPTWADDSPTDGSSRGKLADLVGDLLNSTEEVKPVPLRKKKFKPKGLFLGARRDNGEPIDIKPQILARHAAMLGSTGS